MYPKNSDATGFDTIFDRPFFIGGPLAFTFTRALTLAARRSNFKQRDSLVTDFRRAKAKANRTSLIRECLSSATAPDADILPKLKAFLNVNYIWTATTESTKQVLFTNHASNEISGWIAASEFNGARSHR